MYGRSIDSWVGLGKLPKAFTTSQAKPAMQYEKST